MMNIVRPCIILIALTLCLTNTTYANVTLDCPSGTAVSATCTAYGTLGPFVFLGGTSNDCYVAIIQRNPSWIRLHASVSGWLPSGMACNQPMIQEEFRKRLISGLPMRVWAFVPNPGSQGPFSGAWVIAGGQQMISQTDVSPGPKPETCSLNSELAFVHPPALPGITPSATTLPLPVVCTGAVKGKLTLRGSSTGILPLGSSGLSSTLSVNSQKLGGTLNLNKGSTTLSITSTISGSTSSVGTITGSGVLVLDIL